jgi:DNA polymerase-3 subunit alpha
VSNLFIHLRVHSAYSLSEGAIKTKDLIKLCQKNAMPAVAVTDTNNLFGAMEFSLAAMDGGVQPIIGIQLNLAAPEYLEEEGGFGASSRPRAVIADPVVLLVQNEVGYRSLCALASTAFDRAQDGDEPHITIDDLHQRQEGLILLTGGAKGPLGRLVLKQKKDVAAAFVTALKNIFHDRLYIEIQRHFRPEEDASEEAMIDLAYQLDVPLVATNDCFFGTEDMHEAHDALLCINYKRYVMEDDRPRVTPHHRFKSSAEMIELFQDLPEAIDNSVAIARRCSWLLKPIKPILPAFDTGDGRSEAEELAHQAREGLEQRLIHHVLTDDMEPARRDAVLTEYRDRLEFELNVINNMGFPGYFLIVADFIKWAKNNHIPVGPGRGSGAGSVVAWSLTITDLDPIRWGLLFERFLNPERVSMPDFDIDFCQNRRDEVIDYVRRKYGSMRVAQIITFGKLQARIVVRDVGRVLQLPFGQVDRICKMIPNNPANPVTLQEAIDSETTLRDQRDKDPAVARLLNIALKLEGLNRHASTHAAGVVIGDRDLQELLPLYREPGSDMRVTQFNMKYVEQAGLVKFDFLGLTTLTVLQTAVDLLKNRQQEIDLEKIPLNDLPSFQLLARGEATGVFQLESSGMRDVLRQLKPNRFEDIIALVSLYRPGPMDNIPKYIKVKDGDEPADYLHDSLKPILEETFGIMIYQEQVMQIAQVLSGYSLGGADLLRRAMGKKIKEEMDQQRALFVAGAENRQVDATQAGMIFDQVAKFAGYGFNKSHAAAYALVAFQTAYMKANYPVEFMAAIMTMAVDNTDKLGNLKQELQRLKIKLLPPDINKSNTLFTVEKNSDGTLAIRYALAALKGVGQAATDSIVEQRRTRGDYSSLQNFIDRVDARALNKRVLEQMARAGVFDSIHNNRHQVIESIELLIRHAQAKTAAASSNQNSLFGEDFAAVDHIVLPNCNEWSPLDRLKNEFDAVGFYLSAHPLDSYANAMKKMSIIASDQIKIRVQTSGVSRVRLAGVILAKTEKKSAKGNRYAFVQLSDAKGSFEVTLFSETLVQCRDLLEPGTAVLVTADAQLNGEDLRLTAQHIEPLDKIVAQSAASVLVRLGSADVVREIHKILEKEGKGRVEIQLALSPEPDQEIIIDLGQTWNLSANARASLRGLSGVLEVREG